MREVTTRGTVILLAALAWTGVHSRLLASRAQAAAKPSRILLKASLDPAQPPFAGAVETIKANGQLRIGPFQGKVGAPVPKNGPLTEGFYLGVVRGTHKDLRDANLARVKVTKISEEGAVEAEVGRGLDKKIPVGKLILLVRPPQSTSAQLQALPDLVTIEPGAPPAAEPASTASTSAKGGPDSARAERSAQNLAAIAKAVHKFKDARRYFPSALWIGPDGKPWHSWRVLILPGFDDPALRELYDRYKFDEPWDGPNNKQLLELMPAVYSDQPAGAQKGTFTRYGAVTGPGTMFPAEGSKFDPTLKPMRLGRSTLESDIQDGASNTLMIGTLADDARIPWMKPEDVVVGDRPPRIGAKGGFGAPYNAKERKHALFARADGGLAGIYDTIEPKDLYALLTIAGKERTEPVKIPAVFLLQAPAPANSSAPQPPARGGASQIVEITVFEDGGKPHARLSR